MLKRLNLCGLRGGGGGGGGVLLCGLVFLIGFEAGGVEVEVVGGGGGAGGGGDVLWRGHASPILNEHCTRCHGSPKRKSGLDLRTVESVLAGGDGGAVVVAGKPGESSLYLSLGSDADSDTHMPPKDKQLSEDEIALLGKWIESLGGVGGEGGAGGGEKIAEGEGWEKKAGEVVVVEERGRWLPPAGLSPGVVIDLLIEAGWEARGVEPSERCDDETFVRRVYLDLAGRIPTGGEARAFLRGTESDKRERLVGELLESGDYARHFRDVFDGVLMGLPTDEFAGKVAGDLGSAVGDDRLGANGEKDEVWLDRQRMKFAWLSYLEDVFGSNRGWDEVVRELLLARPEVEEARGANWYLFERADDYEAITDAVATSVFGVQVQCAQCHDHPLASEIYQGHYWGLNAIFSRSTNQMTEAGPGVGESAVGGFVRYTNTDGESYDATLNFLGGGSVDQKRVIGKDGKEKDSELNYVVAPGVGEGGKGGGVVEPVYSRRAVGVDAILEGNELVGRAFVNRMWALLMGRGFVHPVDMMDSVHPPSHPELLDWLARDFAEGGYDIKRLVESIVLSRAYQLDARGSGASGFESDFGKGLEKPLTGEAYYRSLFVAVTDAALEGGERAPMELRALFPAPFAEVFTTTLSETMYLTNGPLVDEMLGGVSLDEVASLEGGGGGGGEASRDAFIRKTYRRVFGRDAGDDEVGMIGGYLGARGDRPVEAYRQWLWAMLTSAEFRINH